jgi:hypothetical protein
MTLTEPWSAGPPVRRSAGDSDLTEPLLDWSSGDNGREHGSRWYWPEPANGVGAVFYAICGVIIVWLLVDVIPHHLTLTISLQWH